jgi:predicted phosphodiesterase
VDLYYQYTRDKANNYDWNGAIGKAQQNWLKQELDSAKLLSQKVILFSHLPLCPESNAHNLWNDYEILEIIESASHVVAFINGHNHAGDYLKQNGIHHITISGMVETRINSYGILEIYNDSLVLRGYGNQESILLNTD